MDTKELLKKVRQIEIKTRRLAIIYLEGIPQHLQRKGDDFQWCVNISMETM